MYIDNENFDKWMERLSKKLNEIGKDLKSLVNTNDVLVPTYKMRTAGGGVVGRTAFTKNRSRVSVKKCIIP